MSRRTSQRLSLSWKNISNERTGAVLESALAHLRSVRQLGEGQSAALGEGVGPDVRYAGRQRDGIKPNASSKCVRANGGDTGAKFEGADSLAAAECADTHPLQMPGEFDRAEAAAVLERMVAKTD